MKNLQIPSKISIFAGILRLLSRGRTKNNVYMKVSLLKISRKKEVIKRVELREIAKMIRENPTSPSLRSRSSISTSSTRRQIRSRVC